MADVDYTVALGIVNTLQNQMSGFARSIVSALDDGKINVGESFGLAMQGIMFGNSIMSTLQATKDPLIRKQVLHVLEHGDVILPS